MMSDPMSCLFIMALEDNRYDADYREAVPDIEECERDNDETSCLEIHPPIRALVYGQRAKRHERKYRERPECEHKHCHATSEETACRKRVHLIS